MVGALGAVAATLIVLRRVVSLTVGNTIDELREDLWSAELDSAVAQSILRLPPSAPSAPRPRLTLAPQAARDADPEGPGRDHQQGRTGVASDP